MKQHVHILCLDDSPSDRELIRGVLEKEHGSFEVTTAATGADFETALAQGNYDIVLSDINTSGFEGLQVLEAVHARDMHLPVIIVTGSGSEEVAVEAIRRGAAEYVIKTPKHIQYLPQAIRAVLEKTRLEDEHRKGVDALHEAEAKYHTLVEQIPVVPYTDAAEPASHTVYVSPRIEDVFGCTPAEWLADDSLWLNFVVPEDRERVRAENNRTDEKGDPFNIEYRIVTKNGQTKWIHDHAILICDKAGNPMFWQGVITDITERKQSEETIRCLARFPAENPNPVLRITRDGIVLYCNQAAFDLLKEWNLEVGKPAPEILRNCSAEAFETQKGTTLEIPCGDHIFSITFAPVPKDKYINLYAREVTERVCAETSLQHLLKRAEHNRSMLFALNQAGQAVQRARSPEEVYISIQEQMKHLGFTAMVIEIKDSKEEFRIAYLDYDSRLVRMVEKVTRLSKNDFRFHPRRGSVFQRVLEQGETVHIADAAQAVEEILPGKQKALVRPFKEMLHQEQATFAPLTVEGNAIGILVVTGDDLSEDDNTAVTAFANQAAIAIENARLYEKVQKELAERNRAEQSLDNERNLLRSLIDTVPDYIYVKDTEARFVLVNMACVRGAGYARPEESLGKTDFDYFPRELATRYFAEDQKVLQSGEPLLRHEEPSVDAKGNQLWLSTNKMPLRDAQGKIYGLVGTGRDITAYKQAEAELEASREAERNFSERLTILSEVTTELSKAENLDALCRQAVELGRERLNFDRLSIFFLSEDSAHIIGSFGVDTEGQITDERGDEYPVSPTSHIWSILNGHAPLLHLTEASLYLRGQLVGKGMHVFAGLWDGNKVIGSITLDNLLRQQPFSDRDCEIIRLYASALGHLISLKRAQEELLASEERYRMLFELSPDSVAVHQEGKVVITNQAAARLLGASGPEEVNGRPVMDFVHPDYRQRVLERTRQQMVEGKTVPVLEEKFLRLDGSAIDVDVTAAPVKYRDKPASMVIFRDISERKRAAEALRESEERFRIIFENANDAIHIDNEKNEIVSVNPRTCEMMGYSQEELLKMHVVDLVAPESRQSGSVLQRELSQQGTSIFEGLNLHSSGRRIPVEVSVGHIERASGDLYVSIVRDISERKRAEEVLERQSEELRLRNEELARLYRASGSLLSGASSGLHELAQTIVEVVQKEFGQANCSLLVVRRDSNELQRLATVGAYADLVKDKPLTLDGPGLVPRSIRTGQITNVGDVRTIPEYLSNWGLARSELTVPLKIGSETIGVIDIQSAQPNAFSQNDERVMSVFAERAAQALENSRLYEQTETRVQQLAALRTIDMAISSSFDISLTLGILLDNLKAQLGIHAADILTYNPATQTFRFSCGQGFRTNALQHTHLRMGEGFAGKVALERRMLKIPDLRAESTGFGKSPILLGEKFVAYVGFPLVAKGQIKGVLEVFQREPLELNSDQQVFLEMLAGQAGIAIDNAELFEHQQRSIADLNSAYNSTLEGWASALELRDKETEGHTRRVTERTVLLARVMGVKGDSLVQIYRGALLHDIGKIGVPDDIVLKPGPLTEEEWVIMRMHPVYAYNLLLPITHLREAISIPYCHHEKWNGTGYPRGLKGLEIPLAARIFSVVDVWDALTSDRPYRKAWQDEKARQYIQEQAGLHFAPDVVEAFRTASFNPE